MYHTHNLFLIYYDYTTIDFEIWKEEIERETNTWYVKGTGKKQTTDGFIEYYYCNRSGFFSTESTGKRQLKTQGSSKINQHCTASITLTHRNYTASIGAKICHKHYGHTNSLGHILLPESAHLSIANQLTIGVAFDRTLDDIRDNVGSKFDRIHLLTRKDIRNIEKAYDIKGIQKHTNDAVSVSAWVEEQMAKEEGNPVVLYKAQGQDQPQGCSHLRLEDFILALQTPLQRDMMQQYGPNKIICMDSTHGTNGYDFQLITVLVVDNYGEGFPVAWCLCNREDKQLLVNFLKHLNARVGQINPTHFMSDDAGQFFTAWTEVFGSSPNKLLCTWHVDRAWRGKLSVIGNKQLEATVYHNLRVLLEEMDTSSFEVLLAKTVEQLLQSPQTETFGQYFISKYKYRKEQWAACYRKGCIANTNMYVESFHRVIKHIYLKGKVNKRIDNCIHILLKYARDKAFDHLVKIEKGKTTKRIHTIQQRHASSMELDATSINPQSDVSWTVLSSDKQQKYFVTHETETFPHQCYLRCNDCQICIHMFSCNCADSLIHNTICKHIHLVARQLFLKFKNNTIGNHETCTMKPAVLLSVQRSNADPNTAKKRLQSKLALLSTLIDEETCTSTLTAAETHITSALSTMKALHVKDLVQLTPTNKHPSNTAVSLQRQFHSTKRKSKPTSVRIAKPTNEQKRMICVTLFSASMHDTSMYMSENHGDTAISGEVLIYTLLIFLYTLLIFSLYRNTATILQHNKSYRGSSMSSPDRCAVTTSSQS